MNEIDSSFTSALDHVQNVILLANDSQSFVYANPAATHLLGYSNEELLQMRVSDITPLLEQSSAERLWNEFLAAGRQQGEFRIRCKDGTVREFQYNAVANVLPGLHMSDLHDITAHKLAAERERSHAQRNQLLVQEMHHRIKNMLANVLALLRSQTSTSREPAVQDLVARCSARIQAMGQVARLDGQSNNGEGVWLSDLVDEVIQSTVVAFAESPQHVTWAVSGSARAEWDTASPLALIVNEAVTNHLKYSTKPDQRLTIQAQIDSCEDKPRSLKLVFSTPFSLLPDQWQPSFGMQLLQLLSLQIGGTLEWSREGEAAGLSLQLHQVA